MKIQKALLLSEFKSNSTANFENVKLKPSVWNEPKNQAWVEVFREGDQKGVVFTRQNLQEMVDAFYAEQNLKPVYIDHIDNPMHSVTEHPASGWILGMTVAPSSIDPKIYSLYNYVEYEDSLAEQIRNKQFQYCSVFIGFDLNRKTGEPLGCYQYSLAIVNQPAVRDLKPLALAASENLSNIHSVFYLFQQEELTRMSDKQTEDTKKQETQANALDPEVDALDEAAAKDALEAMLEAVRAQAGDPALDLNGALQWLADAAAGSPADAMPAKETAALSKAVNVLQSQVKALSADNEKLKTIVSKYEEKEIDSLLEQVELEDGAKAEYKDIAKTSRTIFDRIFKDLPKKQMDSKVALNRIVKNEAGTETKQAQYNDPNWASQIDSFLTFKKRR